MQHGGAKMQFSTRFLKKVEAEGIEKIYTDEPCICMANRISFVDYELLDECLPRHIIFVIDKKEKEENEKIKKHKVLECDFDNPNSYAEIQNQIQEGKTLLVFPEQRKTLNGNVMKIYEEYGSIAYKTNVKIYPICLQGVERTPYSLVFKKLSIPYQQKISIEVGDPFYIQVEEEWKHESKKKSATNQILKKFQYLKYKTQEKNETNLFQELLQAVKMNGEKTVILEEVDQQLTYKELLMGTYALGNQFQKTLQPEPHVGVLLPTTIAHVVAFFGLIQAGKTPAVLNFTMGTANLVNCIETANIKDVITSKQFVKKMGLKEVIEVLKSYVNIMYLEDVKSAVTSVDKLVVMKQYLSGEREEVSRNEVILFTSGSESKPKAVVLSHDNIANNIEQALSVLDITNEDKMLSVMPMFHSFGLTVGAILPVLKGLRAILYPSPLHYKIVPDLIYKKDITVFLSTSTFLQGYSNYAQPYDFHKMRYLITGAEKLKEDIRQLWANQYGVRILEGYGITEASPILSLNTPLLNRIGSVGQLLPGIEYRIEQVEGIEHGGKLLLKGPNIMKGYYSKEKGLMPLQDFHDTGDIVYEDEEGYIYIVSRLKRFAKLGGEMVSLNKVEELLEECFEGELFMTIAVPDKRKGERIVVYTKNEKIKLSPFKKFLKQKGESTLQYPSEVKYIEDFPVLGSGKKDYVTLQKKENEQ